MYDPTLMALAFAEGIALILSPCILPVLPLVLGASLEGGRARPLGIVAGFVAAFTVFAYLSRQAVLAAGIDGDLVRDLSLLLLALFGLVLLFPRLSDRWANAFAKLAGAGDTLIGRIKTGGFFGGVLIGLLIGIVWTPCAGPILAAAILQIIQAQDGAGAVGVIAAFALGAGIPMLFIALFGRYLMARLGFLKRHAHAVRRTIGVIMIAAALTIFTGLDLKLVAWQAQGQAREQMEDAGVAGGLEKPYAAPEITGITGWINSDPLTLQSLRGRVVLIDFWAYSCINCIRTLPYVTKWYDTYKDDGFVVIGVHAPEFPFEKKPENVREAVAEYGIHYPVALDNDFATWRAWKNRYWPAHYLIDRDGRVVYQHFGEGGYSVTEANIRRLLGLNGLNGMIGKASESTFDPGQTPETYLGYARAENFAGTLTRDAPATYAFPDHLDQNAWALSGTWTVAPQTITAGSPGAALRLRYRAGKVHAVLGAADGAPVDIDVLVDGKPAKSLRIRDEKLYTLLENGPAEGILELRANRPGLQAYAFTFGK